MKRYHYRNFLQVSQISFLLLLSFCTLSFSGYANKTGGMTPFAVVTGVVRDSAGAPLQGVSVIEKGTRKGTSTDVNGKFKINVPSSSTLVISMSGYQTQEIPVDGRTEIEVLLKQSAQQLKDAEVVAIGYSNQKKSDLTGAIAVIGEDKLRSVPMVTASQLIQGRVAGVQVMQNSHQPGGSIAVSIRGNNSINASNEPLYVIDGYTLLSGLPYINPSDIVSIEVLKDASATAIYGSQAANGVIIIQTRQGKKGKLTVTFDTRLKTNSPAKKIAMLNAHDFRMLMNEATTNQNSYDGGTRALPYTQAEVDHPQYDINWQDETFRTGIGFNHNLSVTGGSDKTIYAASLNYLDEEGIFKTNGWKQVSGRLNLESQVSNRIRFGTNISYNEVNLHQVETDNGNNSVPRAILESFPDRPAYDSAGNFMVADNDSYANPTALINGIQQGTVSSKFIGTVYGELKLFKGLTFKSNYTYDVESSKYNRYIDKTLNSPGLDPAQTATLSTSLAHNWLNEDYLNYDKLIGAHSLNLLLGASWEGATGESFSAVAQGFPTDAYQANQLQAATKVVGISSDKQKSSQNSFFGRANYNYRHKYFLTGTFRADGSSRFGKGNKYGYFPSGAFAYRLSEEPFIKSLNTFSNLKFRTSYGLTGNQSFANYVSLERLGNTVTYLGNTRLAGVAETQIANPDLKWEKTREFDAGFDVGILKDRLNFTIDYYHKVTSDLLLNAPIPETTGFSTELENIGSVQNNGLEFTLNTVNLNGKLRWTTDFNIAYNKNKVLSLANHNQDVFLTSFVNPLNIIRVGKPLGSFWGLIRTGVFQNQAEINSYLTTPGSTRPGDLKYADLNHDGVINSNDRTFLGNNNPKYIYGMTNNLSLGPWEFTAEIYGVQGVTVMNLNPIVLEDRQTETNSFKTLLNRWHGEGTSNTVAAVRINSNLNISTREAQNGSYLRIRNLSFGYHLPKAMLSKANINDLTVTASAINYFTFTKYEGFDPEVSTYGGHANQGIEFSSYPASKSLMLGLRVTF
jgi:TonB-linked SusC/RagA family outer membrane protein